MAEVEDTEVAGEVGRSPGRPQPVRRPLPGPPFGFVPAVWSAGWITLFAVGEWHIALPMLLLSMPVAVLGGHWRRTSRRRAKAYRRSTRATRVAPADSTPVPEPVAEPSGTAVDRVVEAETSAGRLDPEAVRLVQELAGLLRPLLVHIRERGTDAEVRHDIEAIASEHLPAVLDAYLALPPETLHERTALGESPAEVLRGQLVLLVEGCRRLTRTVQHADLAHQQELSRFLDAKFRRSDLDL